MSFRQYGGLQFSAKNNIVSSTYNNATNSQVSAYVGQPNSYINFLSDISGNKTRIEGNLDMSGNSLLNVGSVQFLDQSFQYTAVRVLKNMSSNTLYCLPGQVNSIFNYDNSITPGVYAVSISVQFANNSSPANPTSNFLMTILGFNISLLYTWDTTDPPHVYTSRQDYFSQVTFHVGDILHCVYSVTVRLASSQTFHAQATAYYTNTDGTAYSGTGYPTADTMYTIVRLA